LADVFGISDGRRIIGPMRWDFMKVHAKSPLLDGISREWIPSTTYHVRAAARGGQRLLDFSKPLVGRYDGLPELSDDPAMVVNNFGRGRAVYFSGDLGNAVLGFHLAEHLGLVRNAVRELSPPPVTLENASRSIEVVLRSQDNGKRLLLHLVNFTGEMTRPIQHVLPLQNVRVLIHGPGEFKKAFCLMRPGMLPLRKSSSGALQFELPRLEEYEVIVIE
jgi:hypothetical protein